MSDPAWPFDDELTYEQKIEACAKAERQAHERRQLKRDTQERAEAFRAALDALCKQHGFTLEHEDSHGAFILRTGAESGFKPGAMLVREVTNDYDTLAVYYEDYDGGGWKTED